MKSLKTILGIAFSLSGLVAAGVTTGVLNENSQDNQVSVKAATNGRVNIFIDDESWWKNASAVIGLTYNSATDSSPLWITPDADLGTVTDGFVWQQFGSDWYGILSMEADVNAISSGNYNNLGIRRRNPNDLTDDWGNDWTLTPSFFKTSNTIVINSSNQIVSNWGNYWKVTTYSGVTSYTNLSSATKAAYLKSAGYTFYPDTPTAPNGYEFMGWYTDTSFTTEWTTSSKPTADVTLYAKYGARSACFVDASGNEGDVLDYNSNNSQFEGIITTNSANEKFAVRKYVGSTYTDYYTLDSYMSSSVAVEDGSYIKVINVGTYIVYLKSDGTIWLETANASLVAYAYAGFFMTNVGCDSTGVNLPSGWSTVEARYDSLTDAAKDYIYSFDVSSAEDDDQIKLMLERYEHALVSHPSLTNFIVNSSGTARVSNNAGMLERQAISNNAIIIAVVISAISVISILGFVLIRKKKALTK